jgi:23S rRNA-/tRNA-specific pseudouridylate synthase
MINRVGRYFAFKSVRIEGNLGRLDSYLKEQSQIANWGKIQALIKSHKIRVKTALNKKITKHNYQLVAGDEISIEDQTFEKYFQSAKFALRKKDFFYIDDIEYVEDMLKYITVFKCEDFIVVNKPAGMFSQGTSILKLNISSILNTYYKQFNVDKYSFVVHRLDKPVSGLMLICSNKSAASQFSEELKSHRIVKTYEGVLKGIPDMLLESKETEFDVDVRIGFNNSKQKAFIDNSNREDTQRATCTFKILEVFAVNSADNQRVKFDLSYKTSIDRLSRFVRKTSLDGYDFYTRVEFDLISGKKHQLRVISQGVLNCPLVGDYKYGYTKPRDNDPEVMVHKILSDESVVLTSEAKSNSFLKDQYQKENYIYLQSRELMFTWKTEKAQNSPHEYKEYKFKAPYNPHMNLLLDMIAPQVKDKDN